MEVSVNGYLLQVTESGPASGIPVVFLHGFPFSQAMWDPQVELLKKSFRVLTYDQRGHGQSDVGDGQYMLEFFVDDFIGLLNHCNIDKAVVCGLSMGGYVALRAIERAPERFRALILCDTQAAADSNEAKIKRAAAIRTVKKEGVKAFAEGFLKSAFAPGSFATHPQTVDKIRTIIQGNSVLGVCGTLLALASRTDTTAVLPQIKAPTLIMVGELDPITPPAAAQAMKDKIPQADLHILPQAAHLSNLENAAAFNQHLADFLQKI